MTTDTLSAAAIGIGSFVVGGLAGGLVGKMTSKKDDALCGPYTRWDPDSAMCVIDTSQSPCDLHPTTVSCDDAIRSESTQLYIRPQTERYDRTRSVCDVMQSSNIIERLQDVSASECRDKCSIDLGCKHITNVKREYTYENNIKTCDPSDVSVDIHDSNYHACEQECNADPNCNIMQYSHNICRKYDMCTLLPRNPGGAYALEKKVSVGTTCMLSRDCVNRTEATEDDVHFTEDRIITKMTPVSCIPKATTLHRLGDANASHFTLEKKGDEMMTILKEYTDDTCTTQVGDAVDVHPVVFVLTGFQAYDKSHLAWP
jgi:hypothetical protein